MQPTPAPQRPESWPEVLATVTACKYQAGAGRALAFGLPTRRHFVISYNYWANGELHEGRFTSATAVPQGHLFPITVNPKNPHETSQSLEHPEPVTRSPLFAIGIIGSIVLSLAWLVLMRGC